MDIPALRDNSFDRYYVEYNGFLSNHIEHALIALQKLGADEAYTKDFVAWYTQRLETKTGPTYQSQQLDGEECHIPNLRGQRKGYYQILANYKKLLSSHNESLKGIIRAEFPRQIQGMAGSAIHGLIQLGFGVAVSSPQIVCEGLAYLHHSYLPLVTKEPVPDLQTFGQGKYDILQVVDKVKQDSNLRSIVLSEREADWVKQRDLGQFQNGMVVLLTLRGDALLKYVHDIKVPDRLNLTSQSEDHTSGLTKWLLDTAIVLYHLTEIRNDFFLLHGVTSSWALQQVLTLVDDRVVSITAVRIHLAILLAAYLAQGAHNLNTGFLSEPDVSDISWEDIKKTILGKKIGTDEHIYKLVQVCYDTSKINKDLKMDDVYKRACFTAMNHDLFFA